MADNIDDKVRGLFEVLQKQKEKVEQAEQETKQSWKTKCSISIPTLSPTPINIQTANQSLVLGIGASLLTYQQATAEAAKRLGLEEDVSEYNGASIDDWFADLKKRVAVIGITEKRKSLVELEKRLDAIVSPEQRRQMELEALTKELAL
ncbi:MAG: hypothetical protein CTY12_00905 [Methylotenera sp.]|nr:MAG: hypothetical protein CTY12_00905 [Methylotenera sp.]